LNAKSGFDGHQPGTGNYFRTVSYSANTGNCGKANGGKTRRSEFKIAELMAKNGILRSIENGNLSGKYNFFSKIEIFVKNVILVTKMFKNRN